MKLRIGNQTAYSARSTMEPFEFALAHGFDAFEWFPDRGYQGVGGWAEDEIDGPTREWIRTTAANRGITLTVHATLEFNPLVDPEHPRLDSTVEFARDIGATLVNVHLEVSEGTITVRDVVAEPPLTPAADDDAPETPLDGWPEYLDYLAETLGPGAYVGDLHAVADLDAVAEHAWPAALAYIAADQDARAALLAPVRGNGREAVSYTAWWLSDVLGAPFAAPGARVPFLPAAPAEVGSPDDAARLGPLVLAALGAVGNLDTVDPDAWERYLDGIPPAGTSVSLDDALAIWRGLAALAARASATSDDGARIAPERVPVLRARPGEEPVARIVDAEDAAVAAEPMWAQVANVVPAPSADAARTLAEILDLPLLDRASDVRGDSEQVPTPAAVLALVPTAPATYYEYEDLTVAGNPVDWWVTPDGHPHAVTTASLARALAQSAGRWDARSAIEILLTDPTREAELRAESAWDPVPYA